MSDVESLVDLFRTRRVVVLTGAGCSTDSGIPDYRGPGTRERARLSLNRLHRNDVVIMTGEPRPPAQ